MSFAPPSGPPPPPVPEGWKAQFHEGYQQWYYVDLGTGKSQWEPPILPGEAPPSYETLEQSSSTPASASNAARNNDGDTPVLGSNNPFNPHRNRSRSSSTDLGGISPSKTKGKDIQLEEDARLAAQLQAEEDARAREHAQSQSQGPDTSQPQSRGENASYYSSNNTNDPDRPPLQTSQSHPELGSQQSHSSRRKGGFLHKLASKAQEKLANAASSSSSSSGNGSHHSSRARYPLGPYYGTGYPTYYASQPGMHSGYGYPMGAGGAYYQPYYGDPYRRRHGGMGTAGAAALGLGGGLLGGALLANAIDDHDHDYGYGDGYDGGDFGGGDFGGGDF